MSEVLKEILYKRELLTQVAEEFHLFGYDKQTATSALDDSMASQLRNLVQIDSKDASLLKVSFIDADPTVAKAVTARFADLFVAGKCKSSQRDYSKFI